jgi:outer membrane protein
MNFKSPVFLSTILSVLALLFVVVFLFFKSSSNEVYYVDSRQLFQEFKMTKETKKNGELIIQRLTYSVDSLQTAITLAENDLLKERLFQTIISKKEEIDNFNSTYILVEQEKIWKRIESYVKDYPKIKEAKIILGSQNYGDVLYVDSQIDITKDLLNFINKRYEGFN